MERDGRELDEEGVPSVLLVRLKRREGVDLIATERRKYLRQR